MTAFQNDDDTFCRKSSVYNQTGETYFQQLSAYNRMSAHLRRVLLAPCVVDSRNRRYTRDKDLARARLSTSRSKSLEKIRKRGNIIDGVAYDTEHHPLDVLRMSLECNSECPGMVKRIVESCTGCDNYSARSRSERTTRTSAGKIPRTSNDDREICTCLRSQICKPCSTSTPKRDSGKSARSTSSRVADRDDCVRKHSHENRTGKRISSRNNVEEAEKFYPYDSSFESSSGNSSTVDSPIRKDREDRRNDRDESPIVVDDNVRRANKFFGNVERNEEAKYAKFIYDVTREIMNSGSYTDHELRAIFKKHIDMNSGTLDRSKMQSEIRQLRMSLNVPAVSDDEDDDNNKDDDGDDDDETVDNRFVGSGKFAKLSPEKPPTPPKILDDGELAEKFRNREEAVRHGDNRKPRDSHGKNTVVLVDANPELLITERDVLLTLMDMKLDPRQIRSICKSLRNKSRETLVSETVQVDAEASYPRVKEDRGNSPINSRTGIRGSDFHSPHPDRTIRTPRVPIRTDICQCQCRDDTTNGRYSAEKTEHRPEMGIQATTTSASRSRSSAGEKSFRSTSIGSSRSKKPRDSRETDDPPSKSVKTSRESLLSSEKSPFRDGSTPPTRLGSTKSRTNRSEEMSDEKEIEKIEKINSRRSTSKSRSENKRKTTHSSGKSGESNGEEDEKPSKINSRRETSMASTGNGGEDDSSAKIRRSDESQRERKSTISGRRSTSSTPARNGDERKSTSFSKPETKRESRRKTTVENFNERTTKSGRNSIKNESVGSRNSSGNDENSNVAFLSHSEFINNLQRDENGSLPDISERSEVIEEDIESDEILTIGSQTTPRPSQIDEVSGDESANVSEHIDHVDEAPIAGESSMSMVSENIKEFRSASPTEAAEAKILQKETSRTKQIDDDEETNFDDGISRSSIRKNDSDDSPEENDSDDNERIVVATSETFLSASSMRKKTSSRISFDDDDERRETRISSVSAKRSSASLKNKMYESSEEIGAKEDSKFGTSDGDYASGKNSEEKFESDISEETKIEVRRKTRSSDDKTDNIASSETELDGVKKSNATMESRSDLEIHEEESGDRNEIENPEDSEPDEEHRESHESGEHSDRDPTTMNEISESRRIIIGAARKSDRSNDDSPEEITEISQRRKRTKSVGSKELGV